MMNPTTHPGTPDWRMVTFQLLQFLHFQYLLVLYCRYLGCSVKFQIVEVTKWELY